MTDQDKEQIAQRLTAHNESYELVSDAVILFDKDGKLKAWADLRTFKENNND